MEIAQLSYVGFGVTDPERWDVLLTEILGMSRGDRTDGGVVGYRMDRYVHRVLIEPTGENDLVYAGWAVGGPTDYDTMAKRLADRGIETTDATDDELALRRVRRMSWFRSPDGLRMEIVLAPTLAIDPFVPGRAIDGFVADDRGVGHIVVRVDDRDRTESFLTDALGLRVTDYGSGRLAFLRCNRRHHSIAIGPRGFFTGEKHMIHLMVQAASLDDLGTAMDLCAAKGFDIPETLGRHTNDQMVSFYIRTPSGFDIEYGVGGREVDENDWVVQSYARKDTWGHERRPV